MVAEHAEILGPVLKLDESAEELGESAPGDGRPGQAGQSWRQTHQGGCDPDGCHHAGQLTHREHEGAPYGVVVGEGAVGCVPVWV